MASGLYKAARQAFLNGDIDLTNAVISGMLIDVNEYTVDLDNHSSQTDVPDAAVWSLANLTGKTVDGDVFRADDLVFTSVEGQEVGDEAGAVILFLNADTLATSILIAYLDNAPEFPIVLDGENVTIVWDTGANGIFRLT